jgi:flagellin
MSDRQSMQDQVNQLIAENSQIAEQTEFNGTKLLDGTFVNEQLQIGANANQTVQLTIPAAFSAGSNNTVIVQEPLEQATVSGQTVAAITASDLKIDGVAIGPSVAGALPGQTNSSAWAIVNAINNANILNLTATANTVLSSTVQSSGNFAAGTLSINGVSLGGFSGINGSDLAASVAAAVNAVSGGTGVTANASSASGNSGTLTLDAADGRDIEIGGSLPSVAQLLGLASQQGTITLTTPASVTASEIVISGNNPTNAGLSAGTFRSVASGGTVPVQISVAGSVADVTSATNAEQTISFIDTQLAYCNNLAAYLGANENVLQTIHANLSTSSVNLQSAQARIEDTDYASETAILAQGKILQAATTAMLAQANVAPDRVVRLLLG